MNIFKLHKEIEKIIIDLAEQLKTKEELYLESLYNSKVNLVKSLAYDDSDTIYKNKLKYQNTLNFNSVNTIILFGKSNEQFENREFKITFANTNIDNFYYDSCKDRLRELILKNKPVSIIIDLDSIVVRLNSIGDNIVLNVELQLFKIFEL